MAKKREGESVEMGSCDLAGYQEGIFTRSEASRSEVATVQTAGLVDAPGIKGWWAAHLDSNPNEKKKR
jgi:hypothetical protein